MCINPQLIQRLHSAFFIQRWNDQARPTPLVEMDKHAHKMAIAYCLARSESDATTDRWRRLHETVRGGIFELLRRSVLSDIKAPIYVRIETSAPEAVRKLNEWILQQLKPLLQDQLLLQGLENHLRGIGPTRNSILDAAHKYASYWEFRSIRRSNPESPAIQKIENDLLLELAKHKDIPGFRSILDGAPISQFLDLVGRLRYQMRWGQIARVQNTSVLGHSMMVACLAYFLVRTAKPDACDARLCNAFFGGLFHDLPEAVTRDIISPIKNAVNEMHDAIGQIEAQVMRDEIEPLIPKDWCQDIYYFTRDEFSSKIWNTEGPKLVTSDEITDRYDYDKFRPLDGQLILVADHLAAYMEAQHSIRCGFSPKEFVDAMPALAGKHKEEKLANLNIGALFETLQNS